MKRIRATLDGGDLRSIGKADEVVETVLKNPELFGQLFEVLLSQNRLLRMRAADALEKITRTKPEWLQPWKQALLEQASLGEDKEVRWHVAQMLPRLNFRPVEKNQAVRILADYLQDKSSIVRTFSMQALVDISANDEHLRTEVRPLIERLTRTGTPAMKARGRKLLVQLDSLSAKRPNG